ncbi:hypothetical protein K6T82_14795 [Flavobacterium sp. 17A]|uniref:DUF6438 domain-containing protein n=1 Tax=Flavobacterium potami TaxID=2872310 RepID=A0A9X1KR17_9FLAO|nr:hypothetical protein [Flavobacterium potami]MBZ4036039.1 hypothetical protein [Flavobacterium potami]
MKKQFVIFSVILLMFSCSKKEDVKPFPFDELIVSSAGLDHVTSIKFTNSDTVYYKRIYPKPIKKSYAILEISDRKKLNELFLKLDFGKFKDDYVQDNLADGTMYLINISKDRKNKKISLYGKVIPQELKKFIDSLGGILNGLRFIRTNKNIDFGDLRSILPPPPPPIPNSKVH